MESVGYHKRQTFVCEFPLDVHFLRWDIVSRNAPRICRNFGSALLFQTRLIETKPVLPLSNERDSQVKDQGRRQCCHNKHKNFPIGLHVMYLYFPDLSRNSVVKGYCNTCSLTHSHTHTHTHTHKRSVRLPWKRDQPITENSTWKHTTFPEVKQQCHRRDSNPQSQQARGRRPRP